MIKLLEFTSWKMTVSETYTPWHIAVMVLILAVSFSAAFFLKNCNEKTNRIIFTIISVYFIFAEVYKELFLSFIVYKRYCWEDFPFQLCSIGMYISVLLIFLRKENINEVLYTFVGTYNLLGGVAAIIFPIDIFSEYFAMTIHSVLWHGLLCFLGFYIIFSRKCSKNNSTFLKATVLYIAFTLIAYILNTLLMDVSGNNMTLFFIGPGKCYIPFFSVVSNKFGQIAETIIYSFVVILFSSLIFAIQKICIYKDE